MTGRTFRVDYVSQEPLMNSRFLANKFFLLTALVVASASTASAQTYRVTIKNLTQNQIFDKVHIRLHGSRSHLFQTGMLLPESSLLFFQFPVSTQDLSGSSSVNPGETLVFELKEKKKRYNVLSLIAPLHATDDGFVGVDRVPLPTRRGRAVTVEAKAYDAGLFDNTESCGANTVLTALRPPEECSPELQEVTLLPRRPIVIHNGVRGIGDISSAKYDWKNPVAEVIIQKISNS